MIRSILSKKNLKTIENLPEIYFLRLQKNNNKNPISPNFNANDSKFYIKVGVGAHFWYYNIEGISHSLL
jgi:hypothetical protein